jgi:hypothetical protein
MRHLQYKLRQGYILLVLLFLSTLACSKPDAPIDPHVLKDVQVVRQNGLWQVVLVGSESMTCKATMESDPLRLVVDLPNTINETQPTPLEVNLEIIGTVETEQLTYDPEPLTRVMVLLNMDTTYEISKVDEKIRVAFDTAPLSPKAEPAHVDSVVKVRAKVPPPELVEVEAAYAPKSTPEDSQRVAKLPLPPASKIIAIEPARMEDDFDVQIVGDGRFDNFRVYTLNGPPRLVVDLLGVLSSKVKDDLNLKGPLVKKVRVGLHVDKARVVFDLTHIPELGVPYEIILDEDRLGVSFLSSPGSPSQ